ncbi:uncharacterized protein (TIGR00255 family) [Robbsia andropogonis]|uniref:YicC family protein n=1 Tax=Robbsia andropogonis TaxID=28092 RepID=UPI003D1CAF51
MIYSMTGFATANRAVWPTPAQSGPGDVTPASGVAEVARHAAPTHIQVEVRTVNSRFLDIHFKMPDEARGSEPAIREMLMTSLSRGKAEVRVVIQRPDLAGVATAAPGSGLQATVLAQLAALQAEVQAHFPHAASLNVGEILRWPGMLGDASVDPETLRDGIVAAAREAVTELVEVRAREGAALRTVLLKKTVEMGAILTRITPLVPELVKRQQQKIVERLGEALGVVLTDNAAIAPAVAQSEHDPSGPYATASKSASNGNAVGAVSSTSSLSREEVEERIRQEVTVYGVRIDIAEELARLEAHLAETRHVLDKGGKVGKRLDFMMQELNREANTIGSKAAAKELADAAMALKLLIEQMREQVQNLE